MSCGNAMSAPIAGSKKTKIVPSKKTVFKPSFAQLLAALMAPVLANDAGNRRHSSQQVHP